MSQIEATSKVNILFFVSHFSHFSIYTTALWPTYSPCPYWNQQLAFFFCLGSREEVTSWRNTIPLNVMYRVCKGKGRATKLCWHADIRPLARHRILLTHPSQMPASIKLQMTLIWNISVQLQIVKAVIAMLTHSMGWIAEIKYPSA